jgi:hypothetical protein
MKTFAKFKKIASRALVLSSIVALSFMLVGCQQVQTQQQVGDNTQQQGIQPKKGLFFFGNDKVKKNKEDKVGVNPNDIERYVKIELESQMPDKVYGGTFPVVVKTENYVYLKPNEVGNANIFKAGTSIDNNGLTITYSVGGSSDIKTTPNEGNFITPLAQFVDGKIIPMYYSTTLGNVEIDPDSNIATLLEKKIKFYLCYPVLKEDQFSLEVPGSNVENGAEAYKSLNLEITPNKGEVTYTISAQGSPVSGNNEEYKYILTIKAKKLSDDSLQLTTATMEKCGPVPSISTGKYPVSYFKIVSDIDGVNIECNNNNANDFTALTYYNGDETSPIVCTITLPREVADKEYSFKIYSAYTLVKTIESKFQVIKNQ